MAPPGARASGFGCLVTTQHQAKPGSADIVPFNHYLSMLHLKKKKKKKRLNSTSCAKSLRVTVNRSVSRETVCSGSTRPVTVFTPCVVINSMLFALQTSPSNDKLRGSHALSRQRVSRPASPWWLLTSPSSPELCPPPPLVIRLRLETVTITIVRTAMSGQRRGRRLPARGTAPSTSSETSLVLSNRSVTSRCG